MAATAAVARALLSSARVAGAGTAAVSCCRRSFSAAAAAAAGTTAKLQAAAEGAAGSKEGFFWMREPRTGNWMPENHFNDVDAADLRSQLLFAKKN